MIGSHMEVLALSKTNNQWIDVDIKGFGQLMEGRPKVAALYDLLQNVFDEDATKADVVLQPIEGRRGRATLRVSDDCPDGFSDLRDAYTLYKSSKKKTDPTKRGRFNEGEKYVLSLCDEAEIRTTTGCVRFLANGQRTQTSESTEVGSIFSGVFRATRNEVESMLEEVKDLIVPAGFSVTINGEELKERDAIRSVEVKLPTVIADENGVLNKKTARNTRVTLHPLKPGDDAKLYEMGIPVVSIDTPWHLNVGQKVPLNRDRDNVTPAYRRELLAAVLDTSVDLLNDDQASETWVKDALPSAAVDTVRTATTKMFGEGWVIATPSDREADKNAINHGKTVVSGGALSRDAWDAIRNSEAADSSSTQYTMKVASGNREPNFAKETPTVERLRRYATKVARHLLDKEVIVEIWNEPNENYAGMFVTGIVTAKIILNLPNMNQEWQAVDSLLIHECAHAYSDDHFTMKYINACTDLGAKLKSKTSRVNWDNFS